MNVNFKGNAVYVEEPNICPHCHITMNPLHQWASFTSDTDNVEVYISVWLCSNLKCRKLFVTLNKLSEGNFFFCRFLNGLPKGPNWPQPIIELQNGQNNADNKSSSKFIKTYLQSLEAENYGLDELAGMGYRKSIEYLVKDWAIQNNPGEKEKVENMWLGNVITNYYDGELKEILERATWLGNDQAHYNKLFSEYDISVLKELIDLIMVELDRQYKKNHYINTIKNKK